MAKISLTEPLSGYNLAAINANFVAIEAEFQDKVLYRNNPVGEPNALETDVDANSKRIYNLPAPSLPNEAARLQDITNAIIGAPASLISVVPGGSLIASNVQDALIELDTDLTLAASSLITSTLYSFIIGTTAGTSAGQTLFIGLDLLPENTEVFYNGVLLFPGIDYTVTTNTVTLSNPVLLQDTLLIYTHRSIISTIEGGGY